jgi:hypothetical protein
VGEMKRERAILLGVRCIMIALFDGVGVIVCVRFVDWYVGYTRNNSMKQSSNKAALSHYLNLFESPGESKLWLILPLSSFSSNS